MTKCHVIAWCHDGTGVLTGGLSASDWRSCAGMEESGVHCTAVYLKQYSPCSVLGPGVRRAQWPDDVFLVVTNFFTSSAQDMQVLFDDVRQ